MEVVHTLDIDGSQWEMQDVEARNRIAELEKSLIPQSLSDIQIQLYEGFSAYTANFSYHYKIGKIHFARVEIRNISGKNIGTSETAVIGVINIFPKKETSFIINDYENDAVIRGSLNFDGTVALAESKGVVQGKNICLGEIIFAEA